MSEEKPEYVTEEQETRDGAEMFWNDKPRELPSVLSGFTPAPDILIKKYGFVNALVWGRIWRYCQMQDGVCRATLSKISAELGMSERTIIRHAETLCENGYLLDTTPDRKNKPHIYADTGKIRIRVSVEAAMTLSHPAMTESHPEGDRESHEESIKKESKKQKIKEGASAKTPQEVSLYREVVERFPPKEAYDFVVESISKVRERLGREVVKDDLRPFRLAWVTKGYNRNSMIWLEWAITGQIPQNGLWKPTLTEPKGVEVARRWLEQKQEA